jgi:hypothetical protein
MLTFKLNINRQTFNKYIATAEKSPIFTSHKSYSNSLAFMPEKNLVKRKTIGFLRKIFDI